MAKGEQRQNVLAQVLSDLDAFGREGMNGMQRIFLISNNVY